MNQKGFTLAELSVCLLIISILAGVSAPIISNIKESLALKKEIRHLYSDLQLAKIEAIKQNTYVVFKVDNQGYRIFVDDGAGAGVRGDWMKSGEEKLLVNHTYNNKIHFEKTTFTAMRTRFNGRVCMKAGKVILRNGNGRKHEIVISTQGRIRTADV